MHEHAHRGEPAGERSPRAARAALSGLQQTAGNRAVQRLVDGVDDRLAGETVSARIAAAEPSGSSLDPATRARVAQAIGDDPGPVRVHTGAEADDLSRSLGARAFTSGQDIFFRSGTFDPATPEGFELLVHESTHVVQQASGPVPGTPTADGALAISDPGDSHELAASAGAEAAVAAAGPASGRSVQRASEPDEYGPESFEAMSMNAGAPSDEQQLAAVWELGDELGINAVGGALRDVGSSLPAIGDDIRDATNVHQMMGPDMEREIRDAHSDAGLRRSIAGDRAALDESFSKASAAIHPKQQASVRSPYDAPELQLQRSVQRDLDDDLIAALSPTPIGPGEAGLLGIGQTIGEDVKNGTLGSDTAVRAAEAEKAREAGLSQQLTASEKTYDSFIDSSVAGVSAMAHETAGGLADVPGLGSVAGLGADIVDQTAHFAGGFTKEGFGVGAGISRLVQDPLGAQEAQARQSSQGGAALGTDAYLGSLGKLSRGEEGLGDAAGDVFNAYAKGHENDVRAQMAPLQGTIGDFEKGDYAGAAGRLGFQGVLAALGMGEAGPIGEVGAAEGAAGVAGDAAPISEGVATEPRPGLPGQQPLPGEIPPTGRPGVPESGVPTDRPLPATQPRIAAPEGAGTQPGLGEPQGPVTRPGLGEPAFAEPAAPDTRPGLGPPLEDPALEPTQRAPGTPEQSPLAESVRTPENAPPGERVPDTEPGIPPTRRVPVTPQGEPVPEQSPLAHSVVDPPVESPALPEDPGTPVTKRSPGNEPVPEQAPVSAEPTTVDSGRLGEIQEQFEKAWGEFSDLPFEHGALPL